jgi:flavin-dependent dehydrogenase
MTVAATIDLPDAAADAWDVVVVGAGPAGAVAARETARRGASVLLVDKAQFPRWKVCGCCLNLRSLAALKQIGLGELPLERGGLPLTSFCLAAKGRQAQMRLPGGVSLSRQAFDAALVEQAILAGARFLPGTFVRLIAKEDSGSLKNQKQSHNTPAPDSPFSSLSCRRLHLRRDKQEGVVAAKLIVAADGLGGRLLAGEKSSDLEVDEESRIGSGVVADKFPSSYECGTIFMACAAGGYVGLVRLEDGRLDVATALDPKFVKRRGGLGPAAAAIVAEAGFPQIPGLEALAWRGTPLLTRRVLRPAGERVLAIGDAAGYIEPFTGEGISWALASGVAVAPLARSACRTWDETLAARWCTIYHHTISRRQRLCRLVAEALRHPRLTGWLVAGIAQMPALANPMIRYLNSVPRAQNGR